MAHPTSMSVVPQNQTSQISSIGGVSWRNWGIWVAGIIVSGIPLLTAPIVKSGVLQGYHGWFNDIFGSSEVIMISVSLAVAALFELLTKNHNPKGVLFLGVSLLVLTLVCIAAYGIVTGITEYVTLTGQGKPLDFNLSRINVWFLVIMFMLGSVSILSRKR